MPLLDRSGCGKSTLGAMLVGLETTAHGRYCLARHAAGRLKGEASAPPPLIFSCISGSFSAVNPRKTSARRSFSEPLAPLCCACRVSACAAGEEMLLAVDPRVRRCSISARRSFSGGQAAARCLARALAVRPQLFDP
ncbi:ATP-binding cassette domain-containing protein [Klebsiella pneumoniae]|nr:ATP-binding cassette domain-containing protein [Klebsiella pneumoniae]